ncbi:uncharacterized protein LOC134671253 [Cydia fagiglandana]|uniref:uncharacterized protein LOC134671253 n=1 Tax=Cydia fagiglandana TaxID=1458189 RepID=UPI002FEE0449
MLTFLQLLCCTLIIHHCNAHIEKAKLEEECKIADICRHDQVPMCGIDSCGELRTFIDTCDMHEFNCDSRKDFVQKPVHECWVTCKRGRSFKRPTYGEGCDGINKV